MSVLISLQPFPKTFLILRIAERDMIENMRWSSVKYTLFLSELNETLIFSTDFRKILKYQI